MKKVLLVGAAVLLCSTAVQAEVSPYGSLKLAYVMPTSSTQLKVADSLKLDDNVAGVRAAVGFGKKASLGAVRAELELQWNDKPEHKTSDAFGPLKGSLKTKAALLNGYYDFKTPSVFVPYVGAGVGISHLKGRVAYTGGALTDKEKVSGMGFAWQAGAGIAMRLTCALSVDLGYRFTDYGRATKHIDGGKLKASMKANEVSLGMRYYF